VGVAVLVLGRTLRIPESRVLRDLIPETPREKVGFAFLSLTAGITEEFIFRGFLLAALTAVTGSAGVAVALSSAVFGILHAYQNPLGAARAGVLGAVLAVPLLATGSLFPSMVAHAAIDVLSGIWLAPWLLRR
jgi:membrane protease YdiL (CAAX protease family)